MKENSNRLLALEGVRGIAAIVVVVYHTILMFYAFAIFGPNNPSWNAVQNMRFEDNLYANPFGALISGSFAVSIFFVLSGFVLSIGFFTTKDTMIIKKLAAKRYLRLMLPALAAVMAAWLFMTIGWSHTAAAASITHSSWLSSMWAMSPHFFEALNQATWGIFVTGENTYNPVLWTMMFEFIGSFIVFLTLLLTGGLKNRWIVYIALCIATYTSWYLGFILGMILADMYANRSFIFKKPPVRLMVFVIIAGVVLAGYPIGVTAGTFYDTLTVGWLNAYQNHTLYTSIGAACLIIGVLGVPSISRFLARPRISGLGKYTFSLYLVHKPVLFTFCAWIFTVFVTNAALEYNGAVALAVAATLPVMIIATVLFERYIDAPSIRISGVFANWLLGLPQKQGADAYTHQPLHTPLTSFVKVIGRRVTLRRPDRRKS